MGAVASMVAVVSKGAVDCASILLLSQVCALLVKHSIEWVYYIAVSKHSIEHESTALRRNLIGRKKRIYAECSVQTTRVRLSSIRTNA
jgi:hypothetical protein